MALPLLGQGIIGADDDDALSQFRLNLQGLRGGLSGSAGISASIIEDEYFVDSGDVFVVKIDIPGPSVNVFNATVTSDGNVLLPDVKSINVRGRLLRDVRKDMLKALRRKNPDSQVEVFLNQIHRINVTILGDVKAEGNFQLYSNSRLYDLVQLANRELTQLSQAELDSVLANLGDEGALVLGKRRVKLKRGNTENLYDVLRFQRTGDRSHNPYLMDNDVIIIPPVGARTHTITIAGAVSEEIEIEYLKSDKLDDVLSYAGGLLPTADSSALEIYRFVADTSDRSERLVVEYAESKELKLQPDDRIFVRYKPEYHPKSTVRLEGEVNYPGIYAIEDGKTRITDLIKKAGGFTDKASLRNSKIIRYKFELEDKELRRLRRMTVEEMNDDERIYLRLRSREDLRLVVSDFEKLFVDKDYSENAILRDEDVVIIPQKQKLVFVSGGVLSPGNVVYNSSWNYENYVAIAGGFNERAKRGDIKIIKNKTGIWRDASKSVVIEEGDIVFVPEKEKRDWWVIFKEGLLIASQIATLAFILSNTSGN